jgi:hypothetical protein
LAAAIAIFPPSFRANRRNSAMVEQDTLYDTVGAAKYLGGPDKPLSQRTLERWRTEGTGPDYLKIGHCIRYSESALDAFKAACMRQSTSDKAEAA